MRRALLLTVALAGCLKTSEKYCELHGADDPAHCPPPDAPTNFCESNPDCTDKTETPVCNTGDHTCVECLTNADCMGVKPVCSTQHTCEGCRLHTDCPISQACLPDGSCAAAGTVAYVRDMNSSGSECSMANPCDKIQKGLATNLPVVKISGLFDEAIAIDDRPTKVTLVGGPGARVSRVAGGGPILEISGDSVVVAANLVFGNAVSSNAIGVQVSTGTTGMLHLEQVQIVNNSMGGLRVEDGHISMNRSIVDSNQGGGVIVRAGTLTYSFHNNIITNNGRSTGASPTTAGGVVLEATTGGKFEYNTVAFNGSSGNTNKPGIQCAGANSALGNVVVQNSDFLTGTSDSNQVGGACDFGNSYRAMTATGLGFKAATAMPPDLHLTDATPASIRDFEPDCSMQVTTDLDGQPRPYNMACDLGADEYVP